MSLENKAHGSFSLPKGDEVLGKSLLKVVTAHLIFWASYLLASPLLGAGLAGLLLEKAASRLLFFMGMDYWKRLEPWGSLAAAQPFLVL